MRLAMRRLRVLLAILGLDQHEAGALVVARILRDAGAEVIYLGTLNLPRTIVEAAVQEDVDIVGISCHSWEVLYYAEDLARQLHELEPPIPIIAGGSVITAAEREEVLAMGFDEAVLPNVSGVEIVERFQRLGGLITG